MLVNHTLPKSIKGFFVWEGGSLKLKMLAKHVLKTQVLIRGNTYFYLVFRNVNIISNQDMHDLILECNTSVMKNFEYQNPLVTRTYVHKELVY